MDKVDVQPIDFGDEVLLINQIGIAAKILAPMTLRKKRVTFLIFKLFQFQLTVVAQTPKMPKV